MNLNDLRDALSTDIWKAGRDRLLIVAGVLDWDLPGLIENLEDE